MNEGETVVSLEAYRQKKKDKATEEVLLQERERAIEELDRVLESARKQGIAYIEQGRGLSVQVVPLGYTGRTSEYVRPRD